MKLFPRILVVCFYFMRKRIPIDGDYHHGISIWHCSRFFTRTILASDFTTPNRRKFIQQSPPNKSIKSAPKFLLYLLICISTIFNFQPKKWLPKMNIFLIKFSNRRRRRVNKFSSHSVLLQRVAFPGDLKILITFDDRRNLSLFFICCHLNA